MFVRHSSLSNGADQYDFWRGADNCAEGGFGPDVRALKQHLHQLHDLPPCFRQRLLLRGQCLEDTAALHPAMELQLVVLAFIPNPSRDEVQEFTAAAGTGHHSKARALNEARPSEQIMQR